MKKLLIIVVITAIPSTALADNPCAAFDADGGACTTTEAKFVNGKSVDCYNCLANNFCLDAPAYGWTGVECEDLTGVAQGGSRQGDARTAICESLIDCVIASSCASVDVSACYCGSKLGAACEWGNSNAVNGFCKQQELDAAEVMAGVSDATFWSAAQTSGTAANQANMIFACAASSQCGICLQ